MRLQRLQSPMVLGRVRLAELSAIYTWRHQGVLDGVEVS
jgi:hypothetical protein